MYFFKLRTKVRTSMLSTRNTLTLNKYKLNIYATHALNPYHQMRPQPVYLNGTYISYILGIYVLNSHLVKDVLKMFQFLCLTVAFLSA